MVFCYSSLNRLRQQVQALNYTHCTEKKTEASHLSSQEVKFSYSQT